jgi:hypothetical protein
MENAKDWELAPIVGCNQTRPLMNADDDTFKEWARKGLSCTCWDSCGVLHPIRRKSRDWDYLNANGLVDGKIPANTECPFFNECPCRTENCPATVNKNIRPHPFSCGAARAFSITRRPV